MCRIADSKRCKEREREREKGKGNRGNGTLRENRKIR